MLNGSIHTCGSRDISLKTKAWDSKADVRLGPAGAAGLNQSALAFQKGSSAIHLKKGLQQGNIIALFNIYCLINILGI